MLIKIKLEGQSWKLFDNAEQVLYNKAPTSIQTFDDILKYIENGTLMENVSVLLKEDLNKASGPKNVAIITYKRGSISHAVVFDTLCYLCTDDGTTVEKVVVNA